MSNSGWLNCEPSHRMDLTLRSDPSLIFLSMSVPGTLRLCYSSHGFLFIDLFLCGFVIAFCRPCERGAFWMGESEGMVLATLVREGLFGTVSLSECEWRPL